MADGKLSEIPQVRFYLTRPFTRLRSVFVALRAFRDRQKIKLHAALMTELLNSDVFPWHCLFDDLKDFEPGVAFSSMK